MKKYIDAEMLIKLIIDDTPICSADGATAEDHDLFIVGEAFAHVIGLIAAATAADVLEVRHGHWKGRNKNRYNDDEATCSLCGVTFSSGYTDPSWWEYCPNCGAKMDDDGEAMVNEDG